MIINKKGAMEMSVGTIVTIVLLMSVLVLGIFLVQKIFKGSNNAIDQINGQVESQINKLFSNEDVNLVLYPQDGRITAKKGTKPTGGAFSFKNPNTERTTFTWTIESIETYDFKEKCGSTMSKDLADKYISLPSGTFDLGASQKKAPELLLFQAPKNAADCSIPYKFIINDPNGNSYPTTFWVTFS